MQIRVIFDKNWCSADKGLHMIKVRQFQMTVNKSISGVEVVDGTSANEVKLNYTGSSSVDELKNNLIKTAKAIIGAECDKVFSVIIDEHSSNASETSKVEAVKSPVDSVVASSRAEESTVCQQKNELTEEKPSAIQRIDERIGVDEFKAFCHQIKNRSAVTIRNNTQKLFFQQAYLFSIDNGCGVLSSIKLLSELLCEVGLFESASSSETFILPDSYSEDFSLKVKSVEANIKNALRSQRIICIDISNCTEKLGSSEIKSMLINVLKHNTDCLILFRTPVTSKGKQEQILEDLNDIISVKAVKFPAFTNNELWTLAQKFLGEYNFSLSDDARTDFNNIILHEKKDGLFYGAYSVKKLVGEFVYHYEMNANPELADNDKLVISSDILQLMNREEEKPVDPLKKLREMIGMEPMINQVNEVINQIKYARNHTATGVPCMHMCFTGNPGTGKTTVARAIGEALRDAGILRIGKFFECKGRDLCGQYIGHTAPKTSDYCKNAYGSVLFIDEAYSLAVTDTDKDYGKEAISTLIAEMENNYDDLIVIFAGYPEEMETLLDTNPGLRSRVPYKIHFEDYTREQLAQIYMLNATKDFQVADNLEAHVKEYFSKLSDDTIHSRSFGNARYVRNLFEKTWGKAVTRAGGDSENIELTIEDFNQAVEAMPAGGKKEEKKKIGFN